MEEKYDTYAYFWVADFNCEPSKITAVIGLEPTRVVLKGESLTNGKTRQRSFWEFHSSLPRSESVQDAHLSNLMKALIPNAREIRELGLIYPTGINCVGYYSNVNPGFHMKKDLIQQCAQLELSIDFDLYNIN
jgi:hypothetical protein